MRMGFNYERLDSLLAAELVALSTLKDKESITAAAVQEENWASHEYRKAYDAAQGEMKHLREGGK